jgi:hypothetical protein
MRRNIKAGPVKAGLTGGESASCVAIRQLEAAPESGEHADFLAGVKSPNAVLNGSLITFV